MALLLWEILSGAVDGLIQPACTQNHRKTEEDGQAGPGHPVQGGFGAAGAAEHRAAAGGQASHAIAFRAVQQNENNQQHTAGDPGPRENRGEHQTG